MGASVTAAPKGKKRLVIGVTGATGAVYGLRLLEMLREEEDWETHLIVSQAGALGISEELPISLRDFEARADVVHNVRNIGATIASGSFAAEGMVIAPCSMKTLAAVAHGLADNLIARAADVMLKERRRLVLMARETPLNLAHIRNMAAVTEMGAIVFPPVPAFYARPSTLDDIVDHSCMRVLDLFGVHRNPNGRWAGLSATRRGASAEEGA
jgi:4-hydroxy-3-polyprenylbenzoate decarboxylase